MDTPRFWAGTAKVDITPPEDVAVDILGQSLKLRDRLQARVLVLKDESTSLAIVAVDTIVFASPKVIAEAKAKYGVEHVILSATHTHASMVPRGLVIKPPLSPDWTRTWQVARRDGGLAGALGRSLVRRNGGEDRRGHRPGHAKPVRRSHRRRPRALRERLHGAQPAARARRSGECHVGEPRSPADSAHRPDRGRDSGGRHRRQAARWRCTTLVTRWP